jgi:hypothetical protein
MECDFRPLLAAADPGREQLLQQLEVAAMFHSTTGAPPVFTGTGREQLLQQLEVAAISHPAAVSPVSTGSGVEQFLRLCVVRVSCQVYVQGWAGK